MEEHNHRCTVSITKTLLYTVRETSGEAGERSNLIGHFLDEDVAKKAGRKKGGYGQDAIPEIREVVLVEFTSTKYPGTFLLGDSIAIYAHDPEEIRAKALAKLTGEERRALGLEK